MRVDVGWLLETRRGRAAKFARLVRLVAAIVFIVFGEGKFSAHASEVASFRNYGLPSPDAFVYGIGVIELGGGVLLALGALTRLAALVLAIDMIAAFALAGVAHGEVVPSLTVAPALFVAMLFLLWIGPGSPSVDERIASRLAAEPPEAGDGAGQATPG